MGAAKIKKVSTLYCSFCGKSQHEVRKIIAGPTVFICDECTELCDDILWESDGDRLMIKVRVPVASEFDEVLYDTMSTLLQERFPEFDIKYECKTNQASEIRDKESTIAVFSALKIYGPEYDHESGKNNDTVREKYEELKQELSSVMAQLSVANQKFVHENKRCEAIQRELADLKCEYLDHLRETSKSLSKVETSLKAILFMDVSGFSQMDKSGREKLLDMLRSMVPMILNGTGASEINMWGDAVVATFDDVNHAIESSMRFIRHLEVDRMNVRVGLAWGEVRSNFNPATGRKDIDGDAVNRAARMEPLAPIGGIIAAEEFGGLRIDPMLAELIPIEVEAKKSFGSIKSGDIIKVYRIKVIKN